MTMTNNFEKIEGLKIKFKSATKLKLNRERDLYRTRNRERSLSEELMAVKAENEFLKEQLEDIKNKISAMTHRISMIGICATSEQCKIDAHIGTLQHHREGFQHVFDKERDFFELRMKEIREKEAEEEELMRQQERELAEKKEQEAKEAAKVEAECDALETECGVLKKRNNAIMLKLRRKLLETENIRRELAKRSTNIDEST